MVMPDTNVWIQLIKGRNPALTNRWRTQSAGDIATCSIIKAELWHGAHKYENAARRRAIVDFWLSPYDSLPFDDAAAHHYAEIRHHLEAKGEIIGPNDLKIAAICRAYDISLATGNLGEFRRVPDLKLVDWTRVV
ncbi:MAG TPA: VapC toxin family PIN domain ribonuclease [Verrucomicrobiales bacterium]|nr:VapC toxin family PIN domain ribonuclease [Verrucomicrobiales bacterium]